MVSHSSPLSTWFTGSNTDNIVNDIALHGVIAIDSDRCDIQCQIPVSKDSPVVMIESTLSYDDIQWCVAAGSTHVSHSVNALDGYVFILHGSVDFHKFVVGHEVSI